MSALQLPLPLATPADLAARLAAHGWALAPDPEGWVLEGNGTPAVFWRLEGVRAWLDKVEEGGR